ncbi:MAG TPA: hypothetical protein VH417_13070 [Vicinamibacterales bacterium]|jgi:hypothetical protein
MNRTGIVAVLAWSCAATGSAQRLNPSPHEVIALSRPLLAAEAALVLAAARQAVDGRTFRLSYQPDGPGPLFTMRSDGRPRYLRAAFGTSGRADTVSFTHFTGTPARRCDGRPDNGELVVEYEQKEGSEWTVKARTRQPIEINASAFDMLSGSVAVTATGPVQRLSGASARPFTAAYRLPEGAAGGPPPGTTMSLWVDTTSLLPVGWSLEPPGLPRFEMPFTYVDDTLQPPTEVAAPTCTR